MDSELEVFYENFASDNPNPNPNIMDEKRKKEKKQKIIIAIIVSGILIIVVIFVLIQPKKKKKKKEGEEGGGESPKDPPKEIERLNYNKFKVKFAEGIVEMYEGEDMYSDQLKDALFNLIKCKRDGESVDEQKDWEFTKGIMPKAKEVFDEKKNKSASTPKTVKLEFKNKHKVEDYTKTLLKRLTSEGGDIDVYLRENFISNVGQGKFKRGDLMTELVMDFKNRMTDLKMEFKMELSDSTKEIEIRDFEQKLIIPPDADIYKTKANVEKIINYLIKAEIERVIDNGGMDDKFRSNMLSPHTCGPGGDDNDKQNRYLAKLKNDASIFPNCKSPQLRNILYNIMEPYVKDGTKDVNRAQRGWNFTDKMIADYGPLKPDEKFETFDEFKKNILNDTDKLEEVTKSEYCKLTWKDFDPHNKGW